MESNNLYIKYLDDENFLEYRKFPDNIIHNHSIKTYNFSFDKPKHEIEDQFIEIKRHKEYVNEETVNTLILEKSDTYIILNCLVDSENQIFQKRKFEITPFEGMDIEVGDGLKIIIQTRTGERRYIFQKDEIVKKLLTHKVDRFSKYAGSSFFPNPKYEG